MSGRLYLRGIMKHDFDDMFRYRNCIEVYQTCRQYRPLNYHDHKKWLEGLAERADVDMFVIATSEYGEDVSGMLVGVCGLTNIDMKNRSAEYSLYIAPGYMGKGYAKEAFGLLLKYGFNELNLNRIYGEIFEGNTASERIAQLYGLKKEGILRQTYFRNGKYIDSSIWSILKDEFDK